MVEEKRGFRFFANYKKLLQQSRFKVSAELWALLSTALALAVTFPLFVAISAFNLPVTPLISLVVFLVVIDILLGYPYLVAVRKMDAIENAMPDALKQMADTLKAGGTYEFALREIATSEYGPLSGEMEGVLRKMEEGENLENSLNSFAANVESRLIKRTVAIIIDSIKAGAGLADILDEIADDVRAMHRIAKERMAETMLQVIFIIAAGSIVAPIILGLISTTLLLFSQTAAGIGLTGAETAASIKTNNFILLLLQAYLLIEVIASGAMISLTREGKISKSLLYIPILLLVAFTCYSISEFASGLVIGGIR